MRFSAWSLRAISVCSALVFTGTAWGHLSVSPTRVGSGDAVDLTFGAPNEDDALGIDHVTLRVPAGFDLDDAEAKPGWTQSRSGDAITWSGGMIPKGQFASFTIRGDAPQQTGVATFGVLVGDRAGKSVTYRVDLQVVSSLSEDGSARSLGKVAIGIALGAALLGLAGLFLGIYAWLRPPAA
jgi:uncharacterized protein YcnI